MSPSPECILSSDHVVDFEFTVSTHHDLLALECLDKEQFRTHLHVTSVKVILTALHQASIFNDEFRRRSPARLRPQNLITNLITVQTYSRAALPSALHHSTRLPVSR